MKKPTKPTTWLDNLDFKQLFIIKGTPGIYISCTKPNKSGMILMEEFLTTNRKWHKRIDLNCLNWLTFYQSTGKEIGIREVFTNIENNIKAIEEKEDTEAMELIVPNYDPDKFKAYHAKKVCNWFTLIKTSYLKVELV